MPFPSEAHLYPYEIRAEIIRLLDEEEVEVEGGPEDYHHLVTLDRTVLDMITHPDREGCLLSYDDALLLVEGIPVPLLDFHSEEWLCHFALGDMFARGMLTGTAPKETP